MQQQAETTYATTHNQTPRGQRHDIDRKVIICIQGDGLIVCGIPNNSLTELFQKNLKKRLINLYLNIVVNTI